MAQQESNGRAALVTFIISYIISFIVIAAISLGDIDAGTFLGSFFSAIFWTLLLSLIGNFGGSGNY